MKKLIALCLVLCLSLTACAALAESSATPLPMGVAFGMDLDELEKQLGEGSIRDSWDESDSDIGSVMLEAVSTGIGDLEASDIYFQVDRNNSAKAPRLSMISMELPIGENVIASFKSALAAFTAQYGEPDSDPFGEDGQQGYVEFGNLSATWTKDDVRINLSMSRMYEEYLSVDYSYRLNYDAADLQ